MGFEIIMNNQINNKRIAKNTLLLYVRMLILMLVSLYTSRVVLNALGVEDYGIYNVVGGFVAMFSIISGSLSAAISRFITFELGTGNKDKLKSIFSSSITIQILLSIIIFIIAETIGLWFLNEKLVIPENRLVAANWCYQFSIASFIFSMISVPYNASIIAHERMSAFAYIGIVEAVGKLIIAFSIAFSPMDHLLFYSMMGMILALLIQITYGWYCKRSFEECTFHFIWDKDLLAKLFSFAGWNFIGSSAVLLRDQGVNIVLNLFCGPVVNAARGVALQVNFAITGFVQNFMTALNPQITKSYACGDKDSMFKLVFQGARFSYYILLLLGLPILVNTGFIMELWLKTVPDYAIIFVRLLIVLALSECISNPLITSMLATGNIRNYQIVVGGLQLLNLPFSYILLQIGFSPEVTIYVAIFISQCCLCARLFMLHKMIDLKIKKYLISVYFNVIGVTIISAAIPVFALYLLGTTTIVSFIFLSVLSVISVITVGLFWGCTNDERQFVLMQIRKVKVKL